MSKPLLGLVLGSILGVFDGLTAWFTPEVRDQLLGIVLGSTMKGLITGVLMGVIARKLSSVPLGSLIGLGLGLLLAFAVALFPDENGKHYYWEIMIPGAIVGLIVGFATQKYGRRPAAAV